MTKFIHEDKAIKDALMRVTPPDIDQSWSKMEELLDKAATEPIAGLPASGILLKQKIWLSSIALLIFSSILIGTMVSQSRDEHISPEHIAGVQPTHTTAGPVDNTHSSDPQNDSRPAFSPASNLSNTDNESGQNNTASVAETNHEPVNQIQGATENPISLTTETARADVTESSPGDNPEMNAIMPLITAVVPHILVDIKSPDEIPWLENDSLAENPGLEGLPSNLNKTGIVPAYLARVGLRLAANTGPGFNYSRIPAQLQAGFYVNFGRNPVHTFQGEVLYNPLPIKAIHTVNVHTLPAGHSLTDSITIRKLNFVSIPIMVKYQLVNNLSFSFGPQISFLTGLTGDKKSTSSVAGEETKTRTYQNLDSKYGMNPVNMGLVVDLAYSFRRISISSRWQYGLTNIEIDNNSPVRVYRNHSNFTFGVAYNLR